MDTLTFPTHRFPQAEWGLRVRAAQMMVSPGEPRAFWVGENTQTSVLWRPCRDGVELVYIQIDQSSCWDSGSFDDFANSRSFPITLVKGRLEVLLGGCIPRVGARVRVDDAGDPQTVFWLGTSETALGVIVGVRDAAGKQREVALSRVHLVDAPGAPVAIDVGLLAFAEGQPLLHHGKPAILERAMHGRGGDVRLLVKPADQAALWCGPRDVTPLPGWTLIHSAALRNDRATLAELALEASDASVTYPQGFNYIAAKAPKAMNFDGMTALRVASAVGHIEAVEALVDRGVHLTDEDLYRLAYRNESAASWAVARGLGARLAAFTVQVAQPASIIVGVLDAGFSPDEKLPSGRSLREKLAEPAFQVRFAPRELHAMQKAARPREPLHLIRPCPSSHTKCMACRKKIAAKTPQFGLGDKDKGDGVTIHREWFHVECARSLHPNEVASAER